MSQPKKVLAATRRCCSSCRHADRPRRPARRLRRAAKHGSRSRHGNQAARRRGDRTDGRDRETAGPDPQAAAPSLRPPFRAAVAGSAATRHRRHRAAACRKQGGRGCSGKVRRAATAPPGGAPAAQSRRPACAFAARRGGDRCRGQVLPLLQRHDAPDRRNPHRDARHRARAAAGEGDPASALRLPCLRGGGRAGARAGAADRWRHGHRGAGGACADQQVSRFPAALPAIADAGASGHRHRSLDAGRLGRAGLLVAAAGLRPAGLDRAVVDKTVRRRHHLAGARSGSRQDQDRASVVLRRR